MPTGSVDYGTLKQGRELIRASGV
ncbi:hypothetical protein GBAR_LOCUS5536 [Geodia barretti]|uniref:Uncharacterized protein n=1 Tax=Geodia barretti TaxID=519541 RepID=A0AA35RB62_GEOBA|nr:hypothetical protein GBAR_LOCUS5536 [Geodia barretti]